MSTQNFSFLSPKIPGDKERIAQERIRAEEQDATKKEHLHLKGKAKARRGLSMVTPPPNKRKANYYPSRYSSPILVPIPEGEANREPIIFHESAKIDCQFVSKRMKMVHRKCNEFAPFDFTVPVLFEERGPDSADSAGSVSLIGAGSNGSASIGAGSIGAGGVADFSKHPKPLQGGLVLHARSHFAKTEATVNHLMMVTSGLDVFSITHAPNAWRHREISSNRSPSNPCSNQVAITHKERSKMINTLMAMVDHELLSSPGSDIKVSCVHQALNYLDRYLAAVVIPNRDTFNTVATACLLLSAKMDLEADVDYLPDVKDFVIAAGHSCKTNKIFRWKVLDMERDVMYRLNYKLLSSTAHHFLREYLLVFHGTNKNYNAKQPFLAEYLCVLSLHDVEQNYLPSKIAASCIVIANITLSSPINLATVFPVALANHTRYVLCDLENCILSVFKLWEKEACTNITSHFMREDKESVSMLDPSLFKRKYDTNFAVLFDVPVSTKYNKKKVNTKKL